MRATHGGSLCRGQQLYIGQENIADGANNVSVDIYDTFGKRVSESMIVVAPIESRAGGFINTVLDIKGELAAGVYMVHITAVDETYTQRLVIQP